MKKIIAAVIVGFSFINSPVLDACSVCFGDLNSPLTHGAKAAVFFLLGVLAIIFGAFFAVAIYWTRRARLLDVQAAIHRESQDT